MTGDGAKTGSWWRKAPPANAGVESSPAAGKPDGRDDEISRQTMADLSRRLGERAARHAATDPATAAAARRVALQEYERTREHRLILVLATVLAALIGTTTTYFVSTIGAQPVSPSASVAARPESAPSPERIAAAPAPAPASPDSSTSPDADVAAAAPATAEKPQPPATTESQQAVAEPAPGAAALSPDEVKEIQARLRSFGFNPGPVDANAGRLTKDAVVRYQRARGQAQTGAIDHSLLEQLRQDPAPQVAQRAAKPGPRATAMRRPDPFEPVRAAGDRLGRWMDSLVR